MDGTKVCPRCRETKPVAAFSVRRMAHGREGRQSRCKACRKIWDTIHARKHTRKLRVDGHGMVHCGRCQEWLHPDWFADHAHNAGRKQWCCRLCRRAYDQERYQARKAAAMRAIWEGTVR
ncbi:MAG: hypothetical protein H0W29_07035 [Gemmatimonadales bacterium]|nr:hypothetical protein [Gemmatimonadales bacterium]